MPTDQLSPSVEINFNFFNLSTTPIAALLYIMQHTTLYKHVNTCHSLLHNITRYNTTYSHFVTRVRPSGNNSLRAATLVSSTPTYCIGSLLLPPKKPESAWPPLHYSSLLHYIDMNRNLDRRRALLSLKQRGVVLHFGALERDYESHEATDTGNFSEFLNKAFDFSHAQMAPPDGILFISVAEKMGNPSKTWNAPEWRLHNGKRSHCRRIHGSAVAPKCDCFAQILRR